MDSRKAYEKALELDPNNKVRAFCDMLRISLEIKEMIYEGMADGLQI